MSLGTEVGLSPCDNVLDGDPAPHGKGTEATPTFIPLCSVTDAHLSNYTVSGKNGTTLFLPITLPNADRF